jgi:HK97 family phage major capsid protein
MTMHRAYALLNVKAVSESKDFVTVEGVASTPTTDRMGDVVEPLGAKFKTPMPFMLHHDATLPVGQVTFAQPTAKGIPFRAQLPIVREPGVVQNRVNEAIHSLKYNLIGAVSIGFTAVESAVERLKTGGLRFKEWNWMELSMVTIPANPDAVITGVKSFDSEVRAALGRSGSPPSPGASGHKQQPASGGFSFSRSHKGNTMTLNEMIEARSAKNARLKELIDLKTAESRAFNDDEGSEFDGLTDQVKGLDDDIRVAKYHQTNSAHAKAVDTQSFNGRGPTVIVKSQDPDDKFKGQALTRTFIAKALAYMEMKEGNYVTPAQVAEQRWGKSSPNLVRYIKAAVAGGGTGSGEWGAELAASDTRYTGDFVELLYARTVFDRLPLRSVPARVHIKGQDGAATGYWVGESKAIPVSKPDFSSVELTPLKVGAIAVCSKELVRDSSPSAEMWIRDALVEASAQRVDATFLSATAASAGVSPAGILNGVTAIAASGADADALRADILSLYAAFLTAKNASGLALVMSPTQAKAISLLMTALGQTEFPGLTAAGGTLLGDQVYVGDNVGPGDIILLKPSDIWKIGDMGVQVSMTDTAMVEQDSAPQGATDTPVAASATMVSLWQEESVGFKVVRPVSWAKRRSHAVQFIGAAAYGMSAGMSTE